MTTTYVLLGLSGLLIFIVGNGLVPWSMKLQVRNGRAAIPSRLLFVVSFNLPPGLPCSELRTVASRRPRHSEAGVLRLLVRSCVTAACWRVEHQRTIMEKR